MEPLPDSSEVSSSVWNKNNLVMILLVWVVLSIVATAIVVGKNLPSLKKFIMRKSVDKENEPAKKRDAARKENIQLLQARVKAYYKIKGFYPNPIQFETMKANLEPLPKDPLEGERVNNTDKIFSYYYDNWSVTENKNTTSTYRLWAFLEDDPEAKDSRYLVTPETYGKKLEVSKAPAPEKKVAEKLPIVQVQQPKMAVFAQSTIYLRNQDKISRILLIIFSLIVFTITIANAYMLYKLFQSITFLMRLLGQKF